MMRIAVVVVALSTACTKPEKNVQGPAQNTAAGSNEPSGTAPPASKDPLDIAIAGLADWKAKMCACSDQSCADNVHEQYKQWETNVVEPMFEGKKESDFPKDKIETAEKLDDERKACRRRLRADSGAASVAEAMAKMAEFKAMMCACVDANCAKQVSDKMTQWSQEQAMNAKEPQPMSEADQKKAIELGTAMGECMQKAMGVN